MFELIVESSFSSAHNLREYDGACERLHGHNWRVELHVEAEKLDSNGLAIDFKLLKTELNKVVEGLDHRYLNEIEPFDILNPSAENLAKFIFDTLSAGLNDGNLRVSLVRVWESEKAAAAYHD
ncbi:MAG: 6-carboxytetrahydropterin synthase QueD [Thermodesulfobacteriota bacterium]